MSCETWQEALSAMADGEEPGIDVRLLTVHVEQCPACLAFAAQVEGARRAGPASAAPAGSGSAALASRVVRLHAAAERGGVSRIARWGLALVAGRVIVASAIALAGHADGEPVHAARHLGAFTMAYGVGLVVVVLRPARAATMLPVAFVLAGALAITTVIDLAEGHIPLVGETAHIPELLSVLLLWLIARGWRKRSATAAAASAGPRLHVVGPPATAESIGETG